MMLHGDAGSLRADLARRYFQSHHRVASTSALVDATRVLEGLVSAKDRTHLWLRVARTAEEVVIDLGDAEGRAVVVGRAGWRVEATSPAVFRRTELTGVMPVPRRSGDISDLGPLINARPGDFDLMVAYLVAAL
jgi:hypothetical protein